MYIFICDIPPWFRGRSDRSIVRLREDEAVTGISAIKLYEARLTIE